MGRIWNHKIFETIEKQATEIRVAGISYDYVCLRTIDI